MKISYQGTESLSPIRPGRDQANPSPVKNFNSHCVLPFFSVLIHWYIAIERQVEWPAYFTYSEYFFPRHNFNFSVIESNLYSSRTIIKIAEITFILKKVITRDFNPARVYKMKILFFNALLLQEELSNDKLDI